MRGSKLLGYRSIRDGLRYWHNRMRSLNDRSLVVSCLADHLAIVATDRSLSNISMAEVKEIDECLTAMAIDAAVVTASTIAFMVLVLLMEAI